MFGVLKLHYSTVSSYQLYTKIRCSIKRMDSIILVTFCVILLVVLLFYYKIRYPFVKKMNEIPGPYGLPFVGVMKLVYYLPRNNK